METILIILESLLLLVGAIVMAMQVRWRGFIPVQTPPVGSSWSYSIGLVLYIVGGLGVATSLANRYHWTPWLNIAAGLGISVIAVVTARLLTMRRSSENTGA